MEPDTPAIRALDGSDLVFEVEAESLAEWEEVRSRLFATQAFRESMAGTQELIAGGRNELWTIEAEG